jgi:molybdenum cofactor biosynthesis enzyme MoaA
MSQCRIVITRKCNLKCKYCCMEYPEIIDSFKQVSSLQEIFDHSNYDTFAVTGGEPTLNIKRLQNVVCDIKFNTNAKVYLWTNGILLTPEFLFFNRNIIDGVNISVHADNWDYRRWHNFHRIIPIRLHVWEELSNDKLRHFCKTHSIRLNEWVIDECDKDEDRFILESK